MARRAIVTLELAGWGGGPGMTYSVHFHGPMTVSKDEELGLLVAKATGAVVTDEWVAKKLGGTSRQERSMEYGQQKLTTKWELKAGTEIRFAAQHVRLMA